jgi:N-acetylneuraminic acid mutarotase
MDPHCQYGVSHNTAKRVYRYHPDRNAWQSVGELPEPRHHHSVAFLNGRVYVIGKQFHLTLSAEENCRKEASQQC